MAAAHPDRSTDPDAPPPRCWPAEGREREDALSLNYIVVRLLQILPTFFLIMVVIFFLVRLLPGDPTSAILGIRATDADVTRNASLGLDKADPGPVRLFCSHFF